MRQHGSILVGLLWCVALLSIVVIGVLHTARLDLLVVKNHGDRIQAHYLALAGVEKAKALLYRDARERRRSARNHSGSLYNEPGEFKDISFGRGKFRVFRRAQPDEGSGVVYGIGDEESRLNVNTASADELGKIYGMTPDITAAIVDWRDGDNAATPGGAEIEHYSSLKPPSRPRNEPLKTTRELLMVRGVSSQLLLGKDTLQNGLLDPGGDPGQEPALPEDPTGVATTGWASLLTVDSKVQNVNARGEDRLSLESADEAALTSISGISPTIAKAILAHRGPNRIESLVDLLEVRAPSAPQSAPAGIVNEPGAPPVPIAPGPGAASGPTLITEDLLIEIADDLAVDTANELPGPININTAPLSVLVCLPGIDRQLAQAIISYRKSSGFFPNTAALLKVPGMNRQIFKQAASRLTARSETYRILSEGEITSTGARGRIQVIVHVGTSGISTLAYREDL